MKKLIAAARGALTASNTPSSIAPPARRSLDELMAEACMHGLVVLGQYNDPRWHASVTLPVVGTGATFKVASGFDHATPHSALEELLERIAQVKASNR